MRIAGPLTVLAVTLLSLWGLPAAASPLASLPELSPLAGLRTAQMSAPVYTLTPEYAQASGYSPAQPQAPAHSAPADGAIGATAAWLGSLFGYPSAHADEYVAPHTASGHRVVLFSHPALGVAQLDPDGASGGAGGVDGVSATLPAASPATPVEDITLRSPPPASVPSPAPLPLSLIVVMVLLPAGLMLAQVLFGARRLSDRALRVPPRR